MTQRPADWRAAPDDVVPVVLLLGGFLTSPPFYRPFRRRLLDRGAAAVIVSNVWTPDWVLAAFRGLGPIVGRGARALARARAEAARDPRTRAAPLLVIGHSAGGIVGRLLTSEAPFAGSRHAFAADVGALVTLGSPHQVAASRFVGRRVGTVAAAHANRVVPGAAFAPTTGYVAVASRAITGRADGGGRERVAWRLYQGLLHDPSAVAIEGDGLVPVRSALLDDAREVILDNVIHGPAGGDQWYGTDPAIDRWWPVAMDAWRAALHARIDAAESSPER